MSIGYKLSNRDYGSMNYNVTYTDDVQDDEIVNTAFIRIDAFTRKKVKDDYIKAIKKLNKIRQETNHYDQY